MSLKFTHHETEFGIGDTVKVHQKIKEGDKVRTSIFEGMVIAFKNRAENKSFTVRRIGVQGIGIERIFPLASPFLEKIDVVKKGTRGVKRAKLYYTRKKSPQEVELIYSRASHKEKSKAHAQSKKKK